ncbi:MAG: hypothetical protein ACOZE5_13205 [Verrucomicrobiota bacterium]
MLAAIITLSLLSLLVATEADPSGSHPESPGDQPLRPSPGSSDPQAESKSKRLAA